MLVYVLNKNGNPLMPCKPAKARRLLRNGNAKIINYSPFTIQLLWDCELPLRPSASLREENVQDVTIGIDKGSKVTGFSCVGNGQIFLSGKIQHRTDIKNKIDSRRGNRRNRRNRKWYRPARFNNRASSKRSGRLPPSIKANSEEVIRVVRTIPLPISQIIIEDVQVDIARLNNPNLQGKDYQHSNRLDENLRIAALMRDDYQCQQCRKKKTCYAEISLTHNPLQVHHIISREAGGKDTITNLITLCHSCHEKVHQGKIEIRGGVSGFADKMAQRTMQGKSYLYHVLAEIAPLSKVFGYQTSAYRKLLGLPKTHDTDGLCIATLETGERIVHQRANYYQIKFRARQTRRQYHDLAQIGKGRVRYQVNEELDGFFKGDLVLVKGKWAKQINSIYSNGRLAFPRVKGEPASAKPKDCQLLQHRLTVLWNRIT